MNPPATIKSPTYARPPLVEVALSLQFMASKEINAAHLGGFWYTKRHAFPHTTVAAPIESTTDEFGADHWVPTGVRFELRNIPNPRIQMRSEDSEWLLQIQSDRLVVNWRKTSDAYPRFPRALDRFMEVKDEWDSYLESLDMKANWAGPWDLTYVNQVADKDLCDNARDWLALLPGVWTDAETIESDFKLRGLAGRLVWEHPKKRVRLYVDTQPLRGRGSADCSLGIQLSARGLINGSKSSDAESAERTIRDHFEIGHQMIVQRFDTMVSEKAKMHWGRQND